MLEALAGGILNVLEPVHLLALIGGTVLGFFGGATPGISGVMMVVVFLPITYGMESGTAFLILVSIYASAVFSGSISAILFRTPGAPEAIATSLDGYPMAQQGKAGEALGYAIMSSAIGGVIGGVILTFSAPTLARFALEFGSPEYFALVVMGLTVVSSLGGGDSIKGYLGAACGLLIATVGLDPITGVQRFTFNQPDLMAGISFIPILIGLFAVSEVIRKFQEEESRGKMQKSAVSKLPGLKDILRLKGTLIRSSLLGTFIGILPGVGATTASMLSYSEAVRWSKYPEKYGTGIPEGIVAPESANNAAAGGALVPLVALGIPGSATTAVILGAFILHGIQPGPLMFQTDGELVYTIFVGMLLVNVLIILLAKWFIRFFAQILKLPYSILGTLIGALCIVGTYAVRNSMTDVYIMLGFGFVGYLLDKVKFPTAPIILGVVLGSMAEEEFRRSLVTSNGDFGIFFTRPISGVLLAIACLTFILPIIAGFRDKLRSRGKAADI
ncbi:MAG: tripartite tricarboxylate transporter permease [Peptococcaceae bacterium]